MKILIDTREKCPFNFLSQCGDIETERGTLSLGDYSLAGLENRVAVERKSLADLVMCLGTERERFERELVRARGLEAFAVVVESSWADLATGRYRSKLNPGAAVASVLAFAARYGTSFFFAGNRENAEAVTAGFLRQYLKGKEREFEAVRVAWGKVKKDGGEA